MPLSLGDMHDAPIKKKIYNQHQAYIHPQITLTNSLKNITQLTLGFHNSQKIKATNELVTSSNQRQEHE